ncbi:MAG: methyltransferase [Nanohaloarchaea archaeon]|nr:methyltransferase [Candidatus Nanohaloarchaea archaeon]
MVYKPAEDSLLLKSVLEGRNLEGKTCLDMGTGSGIIGRAMADSGAEVVSADIDPEALEHAERKAEEEGLDIEFVESDLFENIESGFDLIAFNPPYLPGRKGLGEENVWRGGETGVELTLNFLDTAEYYLKEDGEILLVASSLADLERLHEKFDPEIIREKELWFETLYVLKLK